ncbi:YTH family protein, putative isoform 1 [Hibiscus syriacus]|uniref:YTH family protein, putative isoform 1 n=1 Tax=Hibiscus syriacus TaxID=106335 RepID=A0A6A2XMV2_HIBSY|nr:YTH family protein, putative isoform 1 [Hibiscus syriacus]
MGQISDSLWGIIKSGGMRSEITETLQYVYSKLANPHGKEKGESSMYEMVRVEKEFENNGTIKATTRRVGETLYDAESKEPPGFSLSNNRHSNHRHQIHKAKQQPPRPYDGAVENCKEQPSHSQVGKEGGGVDVGVPPGFSENIDQKQPCDVSDEDPDMPPGFV